METVANAVLPVDRTPVKLAPPSRWGDRLFEWFTLAMALVVVALVFLVGWQLARGSHLAIIRFGFHFLTTSTWDPVAEQYGALPFIYGTAVSSLIALIIAVLGVLYLGVFPGRVMDAFQEKQMQPVTASSQR